MFLLKYYKLLIVAAILIGFLITVTWLKHSMLENERNRTKNEITATSVKIEQKEIKADASISKNVDGMDAYNIGKQLHDKFCRDCDGKQTIRMPGEESNSGVSEGYIDRWDGKTDIETEPDSQEALPSVVCEDGSIVKEYKDCDF